VSLQLYSFSCWQLAAIQLSVKFIVTNFALSGGQHQKLFSVYLERFSEEWLAESWMILLPYFSYKGLSSCQLLCYTKILSPFPTLCFRKCL